MKTVCIVSSFTAPVRNGWIDKNMKWWVSTLADAVKEEEKDPDAARDYGNLPLAHLKLIWCLPL